MLDDDPSKIDDVMSDTPDMNDAPEAALLRQVMVSNHERLNLRLRTMLLDLAGRFPDKGTNIADGESYFVNKWLSGRKVHRLLNIDIERLVARIEHEANWLPWPNQKEAGHAGPLRINAMWAIISRNGMEGEPHRHSGRVSGAYYVDAGACNEAGNGAFAIYTAQGQVARLVPPKTGLMLLFPSNMWHGVLRYESDRPRIVLSFNLS